jgi:hypothetical protein
MVATAIKVATSMLEMRHIAYRPSLQPPLARCLDHRLEPCEECRRVGIVQRRASTDAHGCAAQQIARPRGEALASLAKADELELLYLHRYSTRNFQDVKDSLIGSLSPDVTEQAPVETGGRSALIVAKAAC